MRLYEKAGLSLKDQREVLKATGGDYNYTKIKGELTLYLTGDLGFWSPVSGPPARSLPAPHFGVSRESSQPLIV